MKNRKITWFIAFVSIAIFLGTSSVFAGDPARIGTAGGEQVLIPVGARDLALGGANIALSSGIDAIYWNPAGFSGMNGTANGVFSTMQIFNDVNVNYAAIGFKVGKFGVLGFSLKAIDFGDLPVTTNEDIDGLSGGTFSPTYVTGAVTYSRRLTDAVQVGFSGKLISESVPRASASAAAFDMGIQYHALGGIQGLSLGLAVKNIGTNIQYSGSAFLAEVDDFSAGRNDFRDRPTANSQLPTTVELGLGYRYNINEENNLMLVGDFINNNFGDDNYKLGAEYSYNDLIALRGGYLFAARTGSDDQLYTFTLGVGLHYQVGNTELSFDYAFRDSQYFDGNNLFQVSLAF